MTTTVQEKIRVVSLFEQGKMKPILFSWRHRNYKILQIAFTYFKNKGEERIFYFTVDTGGAMFELAFSQQKFSWEITKIF